MAIHAACFEMATDQGVVGCVMVERHVDPVRLVVASGALCSKTVIVDVVIGVTADTVKRGIAVFFRRLMTIDANRLGMFAQQFVIRKRMIKRGLVEYYDVGISTFVVCVAARTLAIVDIAGFTMKTCAGGQVCADVLVARNT